MSKLTSPVKQEPNLFDLVPEMAEKLRKMTIGGRPVFTADGELIDRDGGEEVAASGNDNSHPVDLPGNV